MEYDQDKKYFAVVSRQANTFVESPFLQEFSEQELKTMEFVISQLTKDDIKLVQSNQIKIISKPVSAFAKMIGAHPNDIYKRAKVLSAGLLNKKIRFTFIDDDGKEGFVAHSIFTSMAYKNGQFTIGINPFVLPYFLDISREYTEFRLANILRIGSSYGIKLYKMLKQYENTIHKYRDFDVEDLRIQFGIGNDVDENGQYIKYNRYNNFKAKVLEIAVSHINQHTDIVVEFTEQKVARKVSKIRFFIKSKMSQLDQAKIIFSKFMDDLLENTSEKSLLKRQWQAQAKDPKARFNYFMPVFTCWLEDSCKSYIAVSTDLLEVESETSMFYNQEETINRMVRVYFTKPKK